MHGNFPGKHENEEIILFFHKHWIEFLYPLGTFFIETVILGVIAIFFVFQPELQGTVEGRSLAIGCGALLLISMLKFWIKLFNHILRMVIITNYRIIDTKQKLFITNDQDVIDIRQLQDVRAETHGFWRNLFHAGNLTFSLTASSMFKVLHNVPQPNRIASQITQIKEQFHQPPKNITPTV